MQKGAINLHKTIGRQREDLIRPTNSISKAHKHRTQAPHPAVWLCGRVESRENNMQSSPSGNSPRFPTPPIQYDSRVGGPEDPHRRSFPAFAPERVKTKSSPKPELRTRNPQEVSQPRTQAQAAEQLRRPRCSPQTWLLPGGLWRPP